MNMDVFEISKIKHDELAAAKNDVKAELVEIRETAARELDPLVGDSVDMRVLKSEFGNLFYGCLEPINGHNIKDRRYWDEDGAITESFDDATHNSAGVFKRIGTKRSYRKNTTWYEEHQVFDKLAQDHVDLIHNGKYSRYDHKEVAKEFLDTRDDILSIRKSWQLDEVTVKATETIPLSLIYHNYDDKLVIEDVLHTTADYWQLKHDTIYLYPVQTEAMRDKSVPESFSVEYRQNNPDFTNNSDWRNKFTVNGWVDVLKHPDTIEAKLKIDNIIQAAEDKLDALKLKYANRLVVKGLF